MMMVMVMMMMTVMIMVMVMTVMMITVMVMMMVMMMMVMMMTVMVMVMMMMTVMMMVIMTRNKNFSRVSPHVRIDTYWLTSFQAILRTCLKDVPIQSTPVSPPPITITCLPAASTGGRAMFP